MKAKKITALLLTAAMAFAMVGCGGDDAKDTSTDATTTPEATEAPADTDADADADADASADAATPGEVSIDFEDGVFGFAGMDMKIAGNADASVLSVEEYNGSMALKVVPQGKCSYVAFQADALLGDNASKLSSVEMSIGTESPDGNFYASAGNIYAFVGEDNAKFSGGWSVYLETANPKTVSYTLPADMTFGAGNYIVVSLETDNAASEGVGQTTMWIDNVAFKDADGNVLDVDTSAVYVSQDTGVDLNLLYLDNAVELEGFAVSAGAWAQAGIDLTEEQRALLVPGSVIEISYSADAPVWLVGISTDENPNPLGTWLRGINQETFISDGYVASANNVVQYTYEQLVPYFGEDFGQYITTLQCESSVDWEVYSVKVGTRSDFVNLASATQLDGFAVSAGAWAQAGIDLTEEQRALLVPGSIIEISYSSESPVWLVAISSDDNANPLGTWLRGVNQETFVVDGAVNGEGNKVQYTYEQLVAYFGEDFGQYTTTLQCESSTDWEVYSVSIGTAAIQPATNVTNLDGFAVSAGAWAQAGIDLTEEQRALLVPGSVINISYSAEAPVWLVAISSDDNANPLGTWLRGVNQETFIVDGAVSADGNMVQYTYEQLVQYLGEDFGQYTTTLQCESSVDWEVYSVSIGMAN